MCEIVTSRTFRGVLVTQILARKCDVCGERVFAQTEIERAGRIVDLKLAARQKAA